MNDLISRQAAYDTLSEYYHHKTDIQHKALREALDLVPDAQPERKKGKWELIIDGNEFGEPYPCGCYCSECGFQSVVEDNFCPYCGADMRGEQND